jgi:hypothetical protein
MRTKTRGGTRFAPKKLKTAEDLDKELDAFMGDSEEKIVPEESAPAPVEGDVDMA